MPVLTTRQAEVLALLAEGHANKEIRYRLASPSVPCGRT